MWTYHGRQNWTTIYEGGKEYGLTGNIVGATVHEADTDIVVED